MTTQKHVMIDLETLGEGSNSVIVQLSAVLFEIETGKNIATFNSYISPNSACNAGLKIEANTFMWWLKQNPDAQAILLEGLEKSSSLIKVLVDFKNWFENNCDKKSTYVWGRGPKFDFGILTDAYNITGISVPWDFRKELCVRTMEFLRPEIKKQTISANKVAHNGLNDCITQIEYVCKIYNEVNITKKWEQQHIDTTSNAFKYDLTSGRP